jgi:hypothetical protein
MFNHAHNGVIVRRFPLTLGETLLGIVALVLILAALLRVFDSPPDAILLLLASSAIGALIHERVTTRRVLTTLAERLRSAGPLPKLEVTSAASAAILDQALNQAIQRRREQSAPEPAAPRVGTHPRTPMVAVLSIALRQDDGVPYSAERLDQLEAAAEAARKAAGPGALVRVEGDGTVLAVLGATENRPIAASMRQAFAVARSLAADESLRFGVSCGEATVRAFAGAETVAIGAPLEDAARLARMATAWHEYRLLCTEPVALLAREAPGHRTELKLTHPGAPTLPVYALDVQPAPVARSA